MLEDLIERLEKSAGPDRHLDALIWLSDKPQGQRDDSLIHPNCDIEWTCARDGYLNWRRTFTPPAYTASLDAAMTLVPKDYGWNVSGGYDWKHGHAEVGKHKARGETPAVALCIAALRSRSHPK